MEENKKNFFIIELFKSIKNFDYYKQISKEKISKAIFFFIKLMFLYSVVVTLCITFKTYKGVNYIRDFINIEISDINYSEGILTINNDEYKQILGNYIVIDTSKENNEEYEQKSNIVIGKKYCSIKSENYIFKFMYNNYFKENINKEKIMDILSNKNVTKFYIIYFFIMYICTIVILAISTILDVLIIALIGIILSKIIGNNKFKFQNLFKIAIHSIALPVLLSMIYYIINTFMNFNIRYFSLMYTSIATIYMVTAILLITSESNKKNNIQNDE